MSTATLTDTDVRVRDAVLRQLEWDPQVDASGIGVTAKAGVVALTGSINSYAGKLAAERAAKRVRGVRGVANDIEVRLKLPRTDTEIATDVVRALEARITIPEGVKATVHSGHVTLTGRVDWLYQSRESEKAVRHIRGVRHVSNRLTVAPRPLERDVRRRIMEALHRHANVDPSRIAVNLSGDKVTLTGSVGDWTQRETAERAAADAPGVIEIENRIVVEPQSFEAGPDEIC